jgi:hypothetical protein
MTTPRKVGTIAAVIHLVFIIVLGYLILTGNGDVTGWLFAAYLDLPVHFLSAIVPIAVANWPAFPLIWFGVLGTVQWFIFGWAAARYTSK